MLAGAVVAALLAYWLVNLGGGGGGETKDSAGHDGKHPAPSITPGPDGSGPAISEKPGGRDESGDGGSSGSTGGSDAGATGGSGGAPGGGSDDGSAGGGGDGGSAGSGGSQAGGTSGGEVPASSSLPTCSPSAVQLTLRTDDDSYTSGQDPRFDLVAKNTSGSDCKIDLAPGTAALTVSQAGSGTHVWASDDCPSSHASQFFRVPAGSSITHSTTWHRTPSAPHCATPASASVPAGGYQVAAGAPGYPDQKARFTLSGS